MNDSALIAGKTAAEWERDIPVLAKLRRGEEALWMRGEKPAFEEAIKSSLLTADDVKDASARLSRFASYIKRVFPETEKDGGILESPLAAAPNMQKALARAYDTEIYGDLLIKLDSHLAVSGSIKARGGIYEVLCVAEKIAMREGGLKITDDYATLAEKKYKDIFSKYEIAVGSTGNLGLSIGIMSAMLGFKVSVHMSADAREWKKEKLRSVGATVIEYAEDYSVAVENGRRNAEKNPYCHFVDDENSRSLFLGYAVAAERLKKQFEEKGIEISEKKPLYIYLPCGVGGGPGGVAFGLKLAFGDNVHCFFAEPTHSPCMMLGMATGLHNAVSVRDFGLDNKTIADGLAVGRASGFVGKQMYDFMDGCYSVKDETMSALLKLLYDAEGIALEPSALAGMLGPIMLKKQGLFPENAYHLVWATGGSMVPKEEWEKYYKQGECARLSPL
jgi:D-serine dehydratase